MSGWVGRPYVDIARYGASPEQLYTTRLALAAGDTLDFVVGDGGDWYYNDLTGITVFVSFTELIANAGEDLQVECTCADGAVVQLNGTGYGPDGKELTYEWHVAANTAQLDDITDPHTAGVFPIGQHLLTLTVTDGEGGIAVDDVLITVVDTIPPTVFLPQT